MFKVILDIDFETRSYADIGIGSAKYAQDPSTEILMMSYAINRRNLRNWNPFFSSKEETQKLKMLMKDIAENPNKYRVRAHHSEFEYWIWNEVGPRQFPFWTPLPMRNFLCTMSLSGGNSYPASLEKASISMDLGEQKDKEGKRLINMFSKPSRKAGEDFKSPYDYPEDFQRFCDYCDQDVLTQLYIVDHCEPLNEMQNKIMHLTEEMNVRGVPIDQEMAKGALKLVDMYKERADNKINQLTDGAVNSGTQAVALTKFLNEKLEAKIPNLKAETIEKYLRKDIPEMTREILEIRSNVSKSSTAKYTKALSMLTENGTVHGFIKAYLTITGRWAGRGIQIQNYSKPDGKKFPKWDSYDIELLCDLITHVELDLIEFLYGDIMDVLKGASRSVICAPKGLKFVCADYGQIEARITMWVAGSRQGMDDFSDTGQLKGKIYEGMAGQIYSCPAEKIKKPSFQRDLGKAAVLGCGFGMGDEKFYITCSQQGMELDKEIAKKAVKAYRWRYPEVKKAWYECEEMAMQAIRNKGHKFYACGHKYCFEYRENGLSNKLPSGRRIFYPNARIEFKKTRFGPKDVIEYMNWDDKRGAGKQWDYADIWGGILFQHGVQATAGDIMANGMLNAEEAGYPALFTVHDESLAMVDKDFGSYQEYEELLTELPPWAKGIPIIAEGWEGKRYRK